MKAIEKIQNAVMKEVLKRVGLKRTYIIIMKAIEHLSKLNTKWRKKKQYYYKQV